MGCFGQLNGKTAPLADVAVDLNSAAVGIGDRMRSSYP